MANWPRLPSLPAWVPFPRVVWFVLEGIVLALAGLVLRTTLAHLTIAVTLANIAFVVGTVTALLGAVAFVVLLAVNR